MNRLVAQAASLLYRRLPVGGAWNKDEAVCATFQTWFMVPMHAQ